jgi:hypothetical protein
MSKITLTNEPLTWTLNKSVLTISGEGEIPELFIWKFRQNAITAVIIENGITKIGNGAFSCSDVASVTIPNSVTTMEPCAFGSTKLVSVTIPNSVTKLERLLFSCCRKLTSITISDSVTTIENRVFEECIKLKNIVLQCENPPEVEGDDAFYNVPKTCTLHVPVGSKNNYAQAKGWKEFKNIIEDAIT